MLLFAKKSVCWNNLWDCIWDLFLLFNLFWKQDMENGLCQVITEKADCINLHATKCLAQDRVDMMKMNFLQTEIAKSNRNNDALGQDFINSCPILSNYQAEFVQNTFGSSKCSYEQVCTILIFHHKIKV